MSARAPASDTPSGWPWPRSGGRIPPWRAIWSSRCGRERDAATTRRRGASSTGRCRITAMAPAYGPPPTVHPRAGAFVGRAREMRALISGLEDAFASQGCLLLLVGEPGIGKTRLAEELAAAARQRDALVLPGRCYAGEGAPPYWPWMQMLRILARTGEPPRLLSELGRGATDLAPVRDALGGRSEEHTSELQSLRH